MVSFSSIISSAATASSLSAGIPQAISDFTAIFTNTGVTPDAFAPLQPGQTIQPLGISLSNTPTPFTVGQAYPLAATRPRPTYYLDPLFAADYAAANTTFVLIFADPDTLTPQQKDLGPSRHYIGPNYHVDSTGLLTNSTPAISEYFGPLPPNGSFPHRYSHFLFIQPPGFEQEALNYLTGKDLVLLPDISNLPMFLFFNSTNFIETTGLGSPVAANFFMSAPDGVPAHSTSGQLAGLQAGGVVPEIVPSLDPLAILDPFFPVNGTTFMARCGENVSATNVVAAPQFLLSFNASVAPQLTGQSFVAIGMDLDATTPQNLHHMQTDLKISSSLNTFAPLTSSASALVEWTAPQYIPGPAHRNLYLLFEQPDGFTQAAAPLASPNNFNLATFKQATGLKAPVAGMFFYSGINLALS